MAKFIPVDLFEIVIFGGTGDLSQRKLLPALWHRFLDGQLPEGTRIIGAARSDMNQDAFQAFALNACQESDKGDEFDDAQWAHFVTMLDYIALGRDQGRQRLEELSRETGGRQAYPCFLPRHSATALRADL